VPGLDVPGAPLASIQATLDGRSSCCNAVLCHVAAGFRSTQELLLHQTPVEDPGAHHLTKSAGRSVQLLIAARSAVSNSVEGALTGRCRRGQAAR
jgi:hypothetical protein